MKKQRFRSTVAVLSALTFLPLALEAVPYAPGDVFASVGNGDVRHFSPTGLLKGTYNIGAGGFTTGSAFDGAGNLYVTGFSANTLAQFDNSGNLLSANSRENGPTEEANGSKPS